MEVEESHEGIRWLQWCKQVDVGEGLAIHTNTPMDLVFATGVCVCVCVLIFKKWIKNLVTVDANQARA